MKRAFLVFWILILSCLSFSASSQGWKAKTENADYIHRAIKEVTDVMVYDIYSPPVSSRTYAYVCVAAYETLIHSNPEYISLAGQLHGLKAGPQPEKNMECSYTLAAVHALLTVGKTLVISEQKIDVFETALLNEFRQDGMPVKVFDNSIAFGNQMADYIIAWAREDHYKETRALPQYTFTNDTSSWKPTPPAYIKAIEPHWNKIRTFIIDSAQAFRPITPPSFSTDTTSKFYKDAYAVYVKGNKNTPEQNEIANFWDCNPFKMNIRGHVMYATKKITPGGHWINITGMICKKVGADPLRSAEAYACVATTIADCFISSWDEKYRSIVMRPETYINTYIDPDWMPALQTPPFPEYTSAHSLVSSGASIMLTKLFGDNFSFSDSTEHEFGLPARSFTSFYEAASEAAISRFYGGIHYLPAVKNGQVVGNELGEYVAKKLKTRKR